MKEKFQGVKALAYISIMSAICLIFVFCGMFLPFTTIGLILSLPLCTTMVVLHVDYRYTLIYSLATSLIAFIDPLNALFLVIPSIITGIVLGILIKKYYHGYLIIFFTSIVLIILQLIAQILIKLLFDKNIEEIMCKMLGFSESSFTYVYLLILFIFGLAQATLSYLIAYNELSKLQYEFNEKKNKFIFILIATFSLVIFSIIFYFIYIPISYLMIGFALYFAVILAYYNFSFYQTKTILCLQLPLFFISGVAFMVLYSYVEKTISIYFVLLNVISVCLVSLYIIIYQKMIKKGKINETLFDKLI